MSENTPKLMQVDESTSGRFPRRQSGYERLSATGIIEIELREVAPVEGIGVAETLNLEDTAGAFNEWPDDLRTLFASHALQSWERTFPSTSAPIVEDMNAAEIVNDLTNPINNSPTYRDRFVTLHFSDSADADKIVQDLEKSPSVARAVSIPKLAPSALPNDPLLGDSDHVVDLFCSPLGCLENQWYVFRCKLNRAWNLTLPRGSSPSGKDVVIAAIDWGVNPLHEDLGEERIVFKFNAITGDANISNGSKTDHGTAVLGIAAAKTNGRGIVGFAPEATLWAIQAGDETTTDHKFWAQAIDRVCAEDSQGKPKIIILEVQTEDGRNIEMIPSINTAIQHAIQSKVVVCVAAGNGNHDAGKDSNNTDIPTTGSILVGATAFDPGLNRRWSDSNHGDRITVYAPGDPVHDVTCGPVPGTYRRGFGGTSGAAPKVAGTVALMLQANPQLSHEQIRNILKQKGTPLADDHTSSFLDAEAAVMAAMQLVQPASITPPLVEAATAGNISTTA